MKLPSIVLLLAMVLGVAGCQQAGGHPNVIIYLVDTLRRDHLSLYGYPRQTSPRLDAFARDAVVFDDARTPVSWTKAATASLLTSVMPRRHGAIGRTDSLNADVPLLGTYLHEAGYRTSAFVTNPNVLPVWGFDRGFDDFHDIESMSRSARADRVNEVLFPALERRPPPPFFFYVHTRDPHDPYDPPPPFDAMWVGTPGPALRQIAVDGAERTVAAYDGEITFNDLHFGALLDRLASAGLYRDALIVFTSDHGEEFWEHGGVKHGHSLYEELLRVPLVIKLPGNEGAGTRISAPVSLLDVVPTVLGRIGAAMPDGLDGRSLLPLLRGDGSSPDTTARRQLFDLDLLDARGVEHAMEAVVEGPAKMVRVRAPDPREMLFDLRADPGEERDLGPSGTPLATHLLALLDEYDAETGSGVNLWLVNTDGPRDHVCEGVLRTRGRFVRLQTAQLEETDRAWLSEEGAVARFAVTLHNRPDAADPRVEIVDSDRLLLAVEPSDAELTVERFDCAGPLHLGADKRTAPPVPTTVRLDDPTLRTETMAGLFGRSLRKSLVAEPGGYLAVVSPRTRAERAIDPELRERLRALGYVD